MQSEIICGFRMDFDEKDHASYIDLKGEIQKLCKQSEQFSILYGKNPLLHYIPIKCGTYITCYVQNGKAEFGIYETKNPNSILQHLSLNNSIELTVKDIQKLSLRMENIAKNQKEIIPNPLYDIWKNHLKEKQITNSIIQNIERDDY